MNRNENVKPTRPRNNIGTCVPKHLGASPCTLSRHSPSVIIRFQQQELSTHSRLKTHKVEPT
jgi:hypothetical protein